MDRRLEELMKQYPEAVKNFKKFEKIYEDSIKYGAEVAATAFKNLIGPVTEDKAGEILQLGIKSSGDKLEQGLTKFLSKVQIEYSKGPHTPHANPVVQEQLDAGIAPQRGQQPKPNPNLKNLDFAPDVSDSARAITNAPITDQYKTFTDTLDNAMRQENANRLKNRLANMPRMSTKPKRPGE